MRVIGPTFLGVFLLVLAAFAKDDRKLNTTPNIYPVKGKVVSEYGPHTDEKDKTNFNVGVDFSCKKGTPVVATADGKVTSIDGDTLTIDHGDDYETVYQFVSDYKVKVGERVKRGTVLGSSKDKLHYQIKVLGLYVDPSFFME